MTFQIAVELAAVAPVKTCQADSARLRSELERARGKAARLQAQLQAELQQVCGVSGRRSIGVISRVCSMSGR